jgi:hypothetical protein
LSSFCSICAIRHLPGLASYFRALPFGRRAARGRLAASRARACAPAWAGAPRWAWLYMASHSFPRAARSPDQKHRAGRLHNCFPQQVPDTRGQARASRYLQDFLERTLAKEQILGFPQGFSIALQRKSYSRSSCLSISLRALSTRGFTRGRSRVAVSHTTSRLIPK